MRHQTSWVVSRILLAAILILGAGCARQDQSSQGNEEPIPIGAVLPLTGPISFLGQSEQQGMSVAADKINAQGGVLGRDVRIVFEDSNPQGDQGVSAARNLIDTEGANFIFTSTTGVSNTIKQSVVDGSNALQFVFAMDERIPQGMENVFRIYPGILEEGETLLKYVRMVQPERVAIMYFDSPAFTGLAEDFLEPRLQEMNIEAVATEGFGRGGYSVIRNTAAKVRSFEPSLVLIAAYYNQIPQIVRALREYNLEESAGIASVLDATMAVDQNQIEPSLLQGVVVAVPAYSYSAFHGGVDSLSADTSFVDTYRSEYGEVPNFDAAYAYDAVMMLAQAISTANTTEPEAVRAALLDIEYQGASGRFTLRSDGNVETSWQLAMYCGGMLIQIKESPQRSSRNAPLGCDTVTAAVPQIQ